MINDPPPPTDADERPRPKPSRKPRLTVVPPGPPTEAPPAPEWHDRCIWSSNGDGSPKLARVRSNAIAILTHHPAWAGKIRQDTFLCKIMAEVPWREGREPWRDVDTTLLMDWLQREVALNMGDVHLTAAVATVAASNAHSSVKDWFDGLTWDGKPRLDHWLVDYLGAEGTEYHRMVGRWWLISAVARVYQPGCKADHVLMLQGPQGIGKSSALRTLTGPDWFFDSALDLSQKDAYTNVQGRLIVELAELDTFRRADEHRAKAFFSSRDDIYTPKYARHAITAPRQCVFAATTNQEDGIFKDGTGNRRYWPVRCTRVALQALQADRENIWAEAREAFRGGAVWWPQTQVERQAAEDEQEQRFAADDWETIIGDWLRLNGKVEVTPAAIMDEALEIKARDWGRSEQMRVGDAMRRLGWHKARMSDLARTRVWRSPTVQRSPVDEPIPPPR